MSELKLTSKLTPKQYDRMMDYIKRKNNGENVGEFVLDYPKTREEAEKWEYKYWNKKPVQQINDNSAFVDIIDQDLASKLHQSIMPEPYQWVTFDINNDNQLDEICIF